MPEDLEKKVQKNDDEESETEMKKRKQGFLISLFTGAVSGIIIDDPDKFELTKTNILAISAISGLTLPFLLNYDLKEKESFYSTFKRNPYYFTGMLTGLTLAKFVKQYFF